MSDEPLSELVRAIGAGDTADALRQLVASPGLAKAAFTDGATRQAPRGYYKGDTALHVAAAGYRIEIVRALVAAGANVRAHNRRGAEPLHYASVGQPGSLSWNPTAQAETITCLIVAGAEPNARNNDEVTPLHRAVRTRCAAAVKALLDGGASLSVKNKHGSTPPMLATRTTGRGGSGSAAAQAELEEIVRLLDRHG